MFYRSRQHRFPITCKMIIWQFVEETKTVTVLQLIQIFKMIKKSFVMTTINELQCQWFTSHSCSWANRRTPRCPLFVLAPSAIWLNVWKIKYSNITVLYLSVGLFFTRFRTTQGKLTMATDTLHHSPVISRVFSSLQHNPIRSSSSSSSFSPPHYLCFGLSAFTHLHPSHIQNTHICTNRQRLRVRTHTHTHSQKSRNAQSHKTMQFSLLLLLVFFSALVSWRCTETVYWFHCFGLCGYTQKITYTFY